MIKIEFLEKEKKYIIRISKFIFRINIRNKSVFFLRYINYYF
jgi:hypothetical protein